MDGMLQLILSDLNTFKLEFKCHTILNIYFWMKMKKKK